MDHIEMSPQLADSISARREGLKDVREFNREQDKENHRRFREDLRDYNREQDRENERRFREDF